MQKNTHEDGQTPRPLQWDDVRHFLALARLGSLSAAARQLAVEHSTVARRVDALEKSLAVRLFDRLAKGWALTAEGEALLARAARMDDEAQAFARAALEVASLQGVVRVSAPPAFTSHFLTPRLAARAQDWPQIDLELVGESRQANLVRGEADIALRMARPEAPGLAGRQLAELGYGLYASAGHLARPSAHWCFLGDDALLRSPQQAWLDQVADGRRVVLRGNDLTTLLHAARAGLGVAALPHFLAADDPVLRLAPAPACPVRRPLWLVLHPDVRRSPRVRLVADVLTALIEDARQVLAGPMSASE